MIQITIEKKLGNYNGSQVLKVNTQFPEASIISIQGPSGVGKTTLLKIIAGFIDPDNGLIQLSGTTWLDSTANIHLSPQKRLAGFVFQNYALFPNMTVLQHLQYAIADSEWINRLLQIGKLKTLAQRKAQHLSGGQQQRLAILRALAIKPKLLLMDEPFSALDPEMKFALIADLKTIFAELKMTVMIVSHNAQELVGLATENLFIH